MPCATTHVLSTLYIDDNYDDQFLFQTAVQKAGVPLRVEPFITVIEAMNYLRGGPPFNDPLLYPTPSFLICDYDLRTTRCSEFVRSIKQLSSFHDVPIVILSDSERQEDIAACYSDGADYYLQKPSTIDELKILAAMLYSAAASQPPDFSCLKLLQEYSPPPKPHPSPRIPCKSAEPPQWSGAE